MAPRQPVVEIIHPLVVESLRKKTPAERLQRAFSMWDFAKNMIRGVLRQEHPDWTEEQILREAARRLSHGATELVGR